MRISKLLVPLQNAVLGRGKTAQNHSPRTRKHHGSEGRRRRKKGGEKVPNVTSETYRKWGDFWAILVPLQNAVLGRGKTAQNHSPRTGKHHGSLQLHLLLLLLVVVMLVLAPADAAAAASAVPWTRRAPPAKSSHLLAFQAQKRRLRHPQTAGPWRTEKAEKRRRKSA